MLKKVIYTTAIPFLFAACAMIPESGERAGRPIIERHTLKELRDQNVIKQEKDYSCGSAALATLLIYYFGEKTSEEAILGMLFDGLTEEEKKSKTLKGFSLLDLKKVAERMGYRAAGFKLSVDQLMRLSAPVIVFVEPQGYKHFAVLRGMSGWRRVLLADPSRGNLRMSLERFTDEYRGVVFVLGKAGEDTLKEYPLAVHPNGDYGQPEMLRFNGQLDLGTFANVLPLRLR
jgi:uncharacterized protein